MFTEERVIKVEHADGYQYIDLVFTARGVTPAGRGTFRAGDLCLFVPTGTKLSVEGCLMPDTWEGTVQDRTIGSVHLTGYVLPETKKQELEEL